MGQMNTGPEISYLYVIDELKQITTRLAVQGIYTFDPSGERYHGDSHGFSCRLQVGTEIRFLSGLSIAPSIQYDGVGQRRFSSIQGRAQINIPLG